MVPGFRPGRAPRQLVVKRFKKQVSDQVKSTLLMSSLEQIDKDYKLDPIIQPRLDVDAIELPEKGPMSFEMDVEVRPQFDVPNYKGLKVKRPGRRAHREGRRRPAHAAARSATARSFPSWKGPPSSAIISRPTWSSCARTGNRIERSSRKSSSASSRSFVFRTARSPTSRATLVGAKPGDTREVEAKLGSAVDRSRACGERRSPCRSGSTI